MKKNQPLSLLKLLFMCAYIGISISLLIFPTAFTCSTYLQHIEFASLKNTSLPQQMHFLQWHTRGDFSTAEEHSGKLQHVKKTLAFLTPIQAFCFIGKLRICKMLPQKWQAPSRVPTIFFAFCAISDVVKISKHRTENWKQEHLRKALQMNV